MKYLLVLVVVIGGLWLLLRDRKPRGGAAPRRRPAQPAPAEMVGCAHCALHLPRSEALVDADGRPYCSDAHRLAGPR